MIRNNTARSRLRRREVGFIDVSGCSGDCDFYNSLTRLLVFKMSDLVVSEFGVMATDPVKD